jgi:flagellar protein FlbD
MIPTIRKPTKFSGREKSMIALNDLSGNEFYLNDDLIFKVEALADTVITMTDGKTLRVRQSPQEILERIVGFKQKIYTGNLEAHR